MTGRMRNFTLVLMGLIAGATLTLGLNVAANKEVSGNLPATEETWLLTRVLRLVRETYVEPKEDGELIKSAISGMLESLDPHTTFLDKDDFEQVNINTKGKFGGLGIEVTMDENGFIKVVSPIDDTPAQRAGLQAGDIIIKLDDKPVKGMSLKDAVNIMRGEPGSDINLMVVRTGEGAPFPVAITRDIIKIQSVKNRMLEDNFGYVRITQFQQNTGSAVSEAIEALVEENEASLKGLVLDLRNNPGGVLTASVDVSDVFLDAGLVVYIQGRGVESRRDFKSLDGDDMQGAPIVVLVNEGSASASEIVAGALQDRGRAVIMGRQTFGKGSVQTVIRLSDDAAVKLTTARYYTPNDRSIQGEGITPDIKVERVKVSSMDKGFAAVKEKDLQGSLKNDTSEDDAGITDEQKKTNLAEKDYMLNEALNLLKGLTILQQANNNE